MPAAWVHSAAHSGPAPWQPCSPHLNNGRDWWKLQAVALIHNRNDTGAAMNNKAHIDRYQDLLAWHASSEIYVFNLHKVDLIKVQMAKRQRWKCLAKASLIREAVFQGWRWPGSSDWALPYNARHVSAPLPATCQPHSACSGPGWGHLTRWSPSVCSSQNSRAAQSLCCGFC